MSNRKLLKLTGFIVSVALAVAQGAIAQSKQTKYSLTEFNNSGCQAKGRVQDCSGKVMTKILADGRNAIPILISQLTETTRTRKQIADDWGDTRSGDVAFVVLTDLFTKPDGQTFEMPDVPGWSIIMKDCNSTAQGCWEQYLRKHGRMSIKQAWLHAWNMRKEHIHWDPTGEYFRVSKQ